MTEYGELLALWLPVFMVFGFPGYAVLVWRTQKSPPDDIRPALGEGEPLTPPGILARVGGPTAEKTGARCALLLAIEASGDVEPPGLSRGEKDAIVCWRPRVGPRRE